MKALITLMLVLAAFWIGKQIFLTYQTAEKGTRHPDAQQSSPASRSSTSSSSLPGLPESLEPSLAAAQQQGAAGLRNWLQTYRSQVRDPRLAAIELDYVVLISLQDPAEARRIYLSVKERTPTFSPVYERVKRLESSLQ